VGAVFLQLAIWFNTGMVKYDFPERETRTRGLLTTAHAVSVREGALHRTEPVWSQECQL